MKWDKVYQPKKFGGLGIRKTTNMNKSLLAKLGWKLEEGDCGLWTQVFRAKYLKSVTFLQVTKSGS